MAYRREQEDGELCRAYEDTIGRRMGRYFEVDISKADRLDPSEKQLKRFARHGLTIFAIPVALDSGVGVLTLIDTSHLVGVSEIYISRFHPREVMIAVSTGKQRSKKMIPKENLQDGSKFVVTIDPSKSLAGICVDFHPNISPNVEIPYFVELKPLYLPEPTSSSPQSTSFRQ